MTHRRKHNKKPISQSKKIISIQNIFSIASAFLLILLIKNPLIAHRSVLNSLKLCASFLIPSLFPLMIASEIATESGAIDCFTRYLQTPFSKIFGIDKNATVPFFLGIVGGYMASVNSAIALYRSGRISQKDCERIICISSFPSLAFFINFIGNNKFSNPTIGWIYWLVAIFSSIVIAALEQLIKKLFTKNKLSSTTNNDSNIKRYKSISNKPFSKTIVDAISHSTQSMLIVCGCVVFFATLTEMLKYPLETFGASEKVKHIILGSLELTNGINACNDLHDSIFKIGSSAFFIGWSGICVHFQIISLCENTGFSYKNYFVFKLIQGLICSITAIFVI